MRVIIGATAWMLALSACVARAQSTEQPTAGSGQRDNPQATTGASSNTTSSSVNRDKRRDREKITPSGAGANTNNMGNLTGGAAGNSGAGGARK